MGTIISPATISSRTATAAPETEFVQRIGDLMEQIYLLINEKSSGFCGPFDV